MKGTRERLFQSAARYMGHSSLINLAIYLAELEHAKKEDVNDLRDIVKNFQRKEGESDDQASYRLRDLIHERGKEGK